MYVGNCWKFLLVRRGRIIYNAVSNKLCLFKKISQ
nr:MAG TPA: hypothetical protein [Caudoviricetes sp.]